MQASIPTTTWQQISVGAKMSTGAREPVACSPTELRFKVGRARRWVLVDLCQGTDTYTVKLVTQDKRYALVILTELTDVYCEDLNRVLVELVNT